MLYYFTINPMEFLAALKAARKSKSADEVLDDETDFLLALATNDIESCPETFKAFASEMFDRAAKRSSIYRENGRRRWEQKKQEHEPQPEPPKAPTKPKPEKHALDQGGFVRVTVDEESALRVKFGLDFGRAVQILADYKESKGKTYRSDAAAMRGWVYDRIQEDKRRTAPRNFTERQNDMVRGAKELIDDLRSGRLHIE